MDTIFTQSSKSDDHLNFSVIHYMLHIFWPTPLWFCSFCAMPYRQGKKTGKYLSLDACLCFSRHKIKQRCSSFSVRVESYIFQIFPCNLSVHHVAEWHCGVWSFIGGVKVFVALNWLAMALRLTAMLLSKPASQNHLWYHSMWMVTHIYIYIYICMRQKRCFLFIMSYTLTRMVHVLIYS